MEYKTYHKNRKILLEQLNTLKDYRDAIQYEHPTFYSEIPNNTKEKMFYLDSDIERLRNAELNIAFVGGFSAGKSTLLNAVIGRYILPEATRPTTAVPTFIKKSKDKNESAMIHYLSKQEVDNLEDLFREEFAATQRDKGVKNMPLSKILPIIDEQIQTNMATKVAVLFKDFIELKRNEVFEEKGKIISKTIEEAQHIVTDENSAMFIDKVVFNIDIELPDDVVLIDLPGISVPNPRHRRITYEFVRRKAHAVVFVLLAERLFDKDESDILDIYRSTGASVGDKTFWALNHWDSLEGSSRRVAETMHAFRDKMDELGIGDSANYYQTNALHGLMAQITPSENDPPLLKEHLDDFSKILPLDYDNSPLNALQKSKITKLRDHLFQYLNSEIRQKIINGVLDNAMLNFIIPVTRQIEQCNVVKENYIENELSFKQKETVTNRVAINIEQHVINIRGMLKKELVKITDSRKAIYTTQSENFISRLEKIIDEGVETDAYETYTEIITSGVLRKYPYYFEIETAIIDNLNTIVKKHLKSTFIEETREIFEKVLNLVRDYVEKLSEETKYSLTTRDVGFLVTDNKLYTEVDGMVKVKAVLLDELLVYKKKKLLLNWGDETLDRLQDIAKIEIFDKDGAISVEALTKKTADIRAVLKSSYIKQVKTYRDELIDAVWPLMINQIQRLQSHVINFIKTNYKTDIEALITSQVAHEFKEEKDGLVNQNKFLRDMCDCLEKSSKILQKIANPSS